MKRVHTTKQSKKSAGTKRVRQHAGQTRGAASGAVTEPPTNPPKRIVRYAVIGLGHIAQAAMLPAFAHAKRNSELAAFVTDDPKKLAELGKRYGVKALYDYRQLRECLDENDIDAVYIATPNSEHRAMVLEAAAAGVHVLCEKPLGVTEKECTDMIAACERAGVHLMTAYRLHFEAANLKVLETIRSGAIGTPRVFTSVFSYQIKDPGNIRLRDDLEGGPLHDIGIYCINAARSVFKAEPIEAHAWRVESHDPRFKEVDETVTGMLRFPGGGIATFTCSFGIAAAGWYQVVGTKGDVCVDPAYEYSEGLHVTTTIGEKSREQAFAKRDQFAAELVYFSECVLKGREPEPSGREGLADVRVIEALEQSMKRGVPVRISPPVVVRYPTPSQRIDRPPVPREPKLVHARSAS